MSRALHQTAAHYGESVLLQVHVQVWLYLWRNTIFLLNRFWVCRAEWHYFLCSLEVPGSPGSTVFLTSRDKQSHLETEVHKAESYRDSKTDGNRSLSVPETAMETSSLFCPDKFSHQKLPPDETERSRTQKELLNLLKSAAVLQPSVDTPLVLFTVHPSAVWPSLTQLRET